MVWSCRHEKKRQRRSSIFLLALKMMASLSSCFVMARRQSFHVAFVYSRRSVRKSDQRQRGLLSSTYERLLLVEKSKDIAVTADNDAFEACWATDTWSINPSNDIRIDQILQGLHSPAPQALFIIERALRIQSKNKDRVLHECSYLLKPGYRFVVQTAYDSASLLAGIDWKVMPASQELEEGWKESPTSSEKPPPTTIQLANQALSLATEASARQLPMHATQQEMSEITDSLKRRLNLTLGTDARGRSAADTAFSLALAGVDDESIYSTLTKISRLEMERVSKRSSRPTKDILQTIEKLAASGVRRTCNEEVNEVYQLAAKSLEQKQQHVDVTSALTSKNSQFDLLSPRPLLWLWRFSARLGKAKVKEQEDGYEIKLATTETADSTWIQRLKDPSKPLVLDLGCGLGVSLIGLASESSRNPSYPLSAAMKNRFNMRDCNYLGADLSRLGINFARGISKRWGLTNQLQFAYTSTEDVLDQVASSYPGKIALILVQFPTPYRNGQKEDGNSQLPASPDDGFMISKTIMGKIANLLKESDGYLLIQTNCEDVGLYLRDIACTTGLRCVESQHPVTNPVTDSDRLPERTKDWIRSDGQRAVGAEWSSAAILPPRCATETEVACLLQGTPIHRCILST